MGAYHVWMGILLSFMQNNSNKTLPMCSFHFPPVLLISPYTTWSERYISYPAGPMELLKVQCNTYICTHTHTHIRIGTHTDNGVSPMGPWGKQSVSGKTVCRPTCTGVYEGQKDKPNQLRTFAEIRAYRWRHAALFPSGCYDCHQNDSEDVRTLALS